MNKAIKVNIPNLPQGFRAKKYDGDFSIAGANPKREWILEDLVRAVKEKDGVRIMWWPAPQEGGTGTWEVHSTTETMEEAINVCVALVGMGMYHFLEP